MKVLYSRCIYYGYITERQNSFIFILFMSENAILSKYLSYTNKRQVCNILLLYSARVLCFGIKASVGKGTFYMIQQNVNLANPSVVCGNLSDLTPNTITLYLRLCIMLTAKYSRIV